MGFAVTFVEQGRKRVCARIKFKQEKEQKAAATTTAAAAGGGGGGGARTAGSDITPSPSATSLSNPLGAVTTQVDVAPAQAPYGVNPIYPTAREGKDETV
jgi:hypothetical protein